METALIRVPGGMPVQGLLAYELSVVIKGTVVRLSDHVATVVAFVAAAAAVAASGLCQERIPHRRPHRQRGIDRVGGGRKYFGGGGRRGAERMPQGWWRRRDGHHLVVAAAQAGGVGTLPLAPPASVLADLPAVKVLPVRSDPGESRTESALFLSTQTDGERGSNPHHPHLD